YMTKDVYTKTLQHLQNPTTKEAKEFFATYPQLQNLDVTISNKKTMQQKLLLLEKNFFDDDIFPSEITQAKIENVEQQETSYLLDDEFDTRSFLMYLYHEIAGFSVDQAAYEILYRTSMNEVIETMLQAGYSEMQIEKTLQMEMHFDEAIYEQAAESIDLLSILPHHEELFSPEETQFLEQVDAIILQVLEKYNIDLEDISMVDEQIEEQLNQDLIKEVTALRMRQLS